MAPHLAAGIDEHAVLSGLDTQRAAAVRSYLAGLQRAGVLRHSSLPLVSENEETAQDRGCTIRFLTAREAGRLLLHAGRMRSSGDHIVGIVVPSGPRAPRSTLPPARQAAYLAWLTQHVRAAETGARSVRLYELEPTTHLLLRRALVILGSEQLSTPLDRLGFVRWGEGPQVPLRVAVAAHPYFAGRTVAVGPPMADVRGQAFRYFLGHALLREAALRKAKWIARDLTAAPHGTFMRQTEVAPRLARVTVAPSSAGLRLELLEQALARQAHRWRDLRWQTADILRDPPETTAGEYLRDILRMRLRTLPARVALSGGVVAVSTGVGTTASVLRARAVDQQLLAAAWSTFYAPPRPDRANERLLFVSQNCADRASMDHTRPLAEMTVDCARALGLSLPAVTRRFQCWGQTLWLGALI